MNLRGQMKKKHKFFRVKADLRRPRINHRIGNQNHKKMNLYSINEGMEAKDIGQCGKKKCGRYYRLVGIIYKKPLWQKNMWHILQTRCTYPYQWGMKIVACKTDFWTYLNILEMIKFEW